MNTIYKSASLGGQQVLPCEVVYPPNEDDLEFVVTWKKGSLGLDHVLLTKVDGYSPTIQKEYQDRLHIVNKASLQISHIEGKDEDWYECSLMFTNGKKETPMNNTWIYLTVYSPPHITRSSRTLVNMPKGETVKLFCEGKGSPEPKITWTKDGQVLNNTARTTVDGNEVRIVNLNREDGGIYTCMFSNIVGDRSQPIKLVVEGGPYIMTFPGNQTVLEGQRVVFPCGTEGYPNTIIHNWSKDHVDVRTTDGYKADRITILNDGSLLIKTTVKSDKGWFTCRPSNGLGQDEASAYLNVVYKPVVLSMPSQLVWAKGYNQQIDCPVDSNPPFLHIIWFKDQEQIYSKDRFNILSNGTLLVNDVAETDAGSYRCVPENTMGQSLSANRVQVLVKDPPQLIVSPQLLYIRNVGDTVVMNCEATGVPSVSMQWTKVGGKLDTSTDRIKITDRYMQIKDLTKEDHGTYECRAINPIATVVSLTDLRIDNTTPHAPFNLTVIPGLFNVTISWEPAHDGGTPQFYVLWFKKVAHSDWITMPVPGQATTSFNLYNLQPDTEYEFKILSRNSFGNGSFSDTVIQRTLGYSPDAVMALPTDQDGIPYYPEIYENRGSQPAAPLNVTAHVRGKDILLKWRTPPSSPVPIFSYKIEYQHDGKWQFYNHRILGNMSNSMRLPNMASGTYDIWLRSYGVLAYSHMSNTVRVKVVNDDVVIPQALIGGIVGGVLFLLVAILLALVAIFYSRRKERKAKESKYNGVNYGKPDEINGRYHEPAAKRNRVQCDGGGGLVTSLSNTDSIFFLSRDSSLSHLTGVTRPLILLKQKNDRERHCDMGGADGKVCDQNYRRQVPFINKSCSVNNKLQLGPVRSGSQQTRRDIKTVTWPDWQHVKFDQKSGSLPQCKNHVSEGDIPFHDYLHSPKLMKLIPQGHPPVVKSHSFPSHNQTSRAQFPGHISRHQCQTSQIPSSSSCPSYLPQFHPSCTSSHSASLQDNSCDPAGISNIHLNQPPQNFVTQGHGISRSLLQLSGRPQALSPAKIMPGQISHLNYDRVDHHHHHHYHHQNLCHHLQDTNSILDSSYGKPHQMLLNVSKISTPSSKSVNISSNEESIKIPEIKVSACDNTQPFETSFHNPKCFTLSRIRETHRRSPREFDSTEAQPEGIAQLTSDIRRTSTHIPQCTFSQKVTSSDVTHSISAGRPVLQENSSDVPCSHPGLKSHNYFCSTSHHTSDDKSQDMSYHMSEPCFSNTPSRFCSKRKESQPNKPRSYLGSGFYDINQDLYTGGKSPYTSVGEKSPYTSVGEKSPYTSVGKKSPYTSGGGKSPYTSVDGKSPYTSVSEKSPYTSVGEKSPYTSVGEKSSYTSVGKKSSYTSGGGKSPYTSVDGKSPYTSVSEKSPYSSASYPDVSLRQHKVGSSGSGFAHFLNRDIQGFCSRSKSHDSGIRICDYNQQKKYMPHLQRTSDFYKDNTTEPYHGNCFEHPSLNSQIYDPKVSSDKPLQNFPEYSRSYNTDTARTATLQNVNSHHIYYHDSSSIEHAPCSSVQNHDFIRDQSSGNIHSRYAIDIERYPFYLSHELENDTASFNKNSRMPERSRCGHPSQITEKDISFSHPSRRIWYPDSEQRFQRLREEFRQYRQKNLFPSSRSQQRSSTSTVTLPTELNKDPLYPMDSEML